MPSPISHLVKKKTPFPAKVPTLRERLMEYGKANNWPHIGFGGVWPESGNVRYAIGADTENVADRRAIWTIMLASCDEEMVNALADTLGIERVEGRSA